MNGSHEFKVFIISIVGAFFTLSPELVCAQAGVSSGPSATLESVARVAVAVGAAHKIGPAGRTERLLVGANISPGDRVRTGPDGVAILVFQDEGRVSLRSDSELLVRHYEIDPAGVKTRIELELVKGTLRQISGNASRSQPERYRLNTPIAVIGVRGTDFLAKSTAQSVEAFVHEGRIVLTPLAGACAGVSCEAVALSSSSGSQLQYVRMNVGGQIETREFKPGELERVFGIETARINRGSSGGLAASTLDVKWPAAAHWVTDSIFAARGLEPLNLPDMPARDGASSGATGDAGASNSSGTSGSTMPGQGSVAGGSTSVAAGSGLPGTGAQTGGDAAANAATASPPVLAGALPGAPSAPPFEPVPAAALATAPMPAQLVWGRFSSADALPAQFLLPYAVASQGRHVTVGQLGQYALWRADPLGRLDPTIAGKAEFSLAAAEAVLVRPAGISSAVVTSATLNVDFDRYAFAAAVGLYHDAVGRESIAVTGRMNTEGVFVGTNASETVAGAVSKDGKEAGYLFSKDVSAGTFRGVTLWGRK
jgi:hypothetical protein